MDYQSVKNTQQDLRVKLRKTNESLSRAERRFDIANLQAEAEEDKQYLNIKAKEDKITEQYAKAKARELAYQKYIDSIIKKSVMKKLAREYEILKMEWSESVCDQSKARDDSKRFDYNTNQ